MLALTYPDGARVQCYDYLPENPSISSLIFDRIISSRDSLVSRSDKNLKIDYASRFRDRNLRRSVTIRRKNLNNIKNNLKNYAEIQVSSLSSSPSSSSSSPSSPSSLPLCEGYNGNEFRYNKPTDNENKNEDEVDPGHKFRTSSQSCTEKISKDDEKFSIFNVEEDNCKSKSKSKPKTKIKTKTKTKCKFNIRRCELPGRESWPGGRHPKDRCFFLQLLLILVLIIIGSNRHCGPFGSKVNRTVFSVFAFGTVAVGQVGSAPVDIINDTGVRSERSANLSHITGTSRKIQMYIKHRHLQILPDGTVNGSNDDTSDFTVLQRTSVSRGQLRIQGVATCLYLCMDSCGLLYGSREYTEDCVFNETLEQHNYNTYSSAHWSTPKKTLYIGLTGKGQPRRVQAKGHKLGKLSAYARVLTQVVAQDRVEALHRRMLGARHNVRHHHGSQQTICPAPTPQEKDGRDKFRCRKRKKRKKRRRKCRPGEIPGAAQCDIRENGSGIGIETQSKRSCEGAAVDEACRREALDTPAKKRKSRIEDDESINERATGDIDDVQEEDVTIGIQDGKSRRSNDRGINILQKRKGKKSGNHQTGKKSGSSGLVKKRKSGVKNFKRKGQNHSSIGGRFVRTTYRLSSSPSMTSPISSWSSLMTTSPTFVNPETTSGIFIERPKSLSSSSSAVSAVSLAATSLASTLTLTVASGEVFTETNGNSEGSLQIQGRTDSVLDLEEFVDLKEFIDEDEDDDLLRENDEDEDEKFHSVSKKMETDDDRGGLIAM